LHEQPDEVGNLGFAPDEGGWLAGEPSLDATMRIRRHRPSDRRAMHLPDADLQAKGGLITSAEDVGIQRLAYRVWLHIQIALQCVTQPLILRQRATTLATHRIQVHEPEVPRFVQGLGLKEPLDGVDS
jgi:hypothetical protein